MENNNKWEECLSDDSDTNHGNMCDCLELIPNKKAEGKNKLIDAFEGRFEESNEGKQEMFHGQVHETLHGNQNQILLTQENIHDLIGLLYSILVYEQVAVDHSSLADISTKLNMNAIFTWLTGDPLQGRQLVRRITGFEIENELDEKSQKKLQKCQFECKIFKKKRQIEKQTSNKKPYDKRTVTIFDALNLFQQREFRVAKKGSREGCFRQNFSKKYFSNEDLAMILETISPQNVDDHYQRYVKKGLDDLFDELFHAVTLKQQQDLIKTFCEDSLSFCCVAFSFQETTISVSEILQNNKYSK